MNPFNAQPQATPLQDAQHHINEIRRHNQALKALNTVKPGDVQVAEEEDFFGEDYLLTLIEDPTATIPALSEENLAVVKGFTRYCRGASLDWLLSSSTKEGQDFREALSEVLAHTAFDTYNPTTGLLQLHLPDELMQNPYIKLLFGIEEPATTTA